MSVLPTLSLDLRACLRYHKLHRSVLEQYFHCRNIQRYPELRKLSTAAVNMAKAKVLVTRKDLPQEALDMLYDKFDIDMWPEASPIPREELLKRIPGKDAVYCLLTEKIDAEVLDAAGSSLKVIGTMSVGYDHLDIPEIKKRGIKVGNTPGVLTDATAELTVALLLATARRFFECHNELLNGGWAKCAWSPLWMTGTGLFGSTVGIFGMGRIGQAVVRRLSGFNVARFLYTGHGPKPEGKELGAEFVTFDNLLKESDFVLITSALTEETKEIFNEDAFAKMKNSAILINTSRGGVIKQDALIKALKTNQIRAAGLDVMVPEPLPTDHELTKLPNCTLIPHIGSAEVKTRTAMATLTVANIAAALEDQPMPAQLC